MPSDQEVEAATTALRKLAAEVGGLRPFESELRAELGNTNWNVLMLRLREADEALERLQAASATPQGEPVGDWVMVPREPTEDMRKALNAHPLFKEGYSAMLAAAPPAPLVVDEDMVERAEEAFYGRHERGFIMRPLIRDEAGRYDMRAALIAALSNPGATQ